MQEIVNKSEEQKSAEANVETFREHLGPFVVAVETTRMPMVFTDAKEPDRPIIFANDSFLSLSGYDRKDLLGQTFSSFLVRGADPEALAQVEAAFEGHFDGNPEVQYRRKDGSGFWASLFISPVRDENGLIVQHFISLVDLTRRRQENAQARMLIDELKHEQAKSRVLIDELNHRVKNTLATVQSITAQALRNSSDPNVIRESIESRLFALSRSHDLLNYEKWQSAGLRDIIKAALEPFGIADGRAKSFTITGKNVRFSPSVTLALGIAFHELASNAVKYGALSNEAGSILIEWMIEPRLERDRLILRWREMDGPPVMPPSRKGFGSRVIERGLAHELEGTVHLDYQADGVVCTIDVPAPAEVLDE